jgi:IclR family transcriptional regulator, acetate operon repressor
MLKLVAAEESEMSTATIASRLGLSHGTANRIIRALMAEGLLTQNPSTSHYYLGSATVLLGQAAQLGFGLDKALPVLEQVRKQTGESVNLVVREGQESVVMMRAPSTLPLRFEQRIGARFPLYATASGKAILAASPDSEQYIAQLPAKLDPITPQTLSTPAQLADQLGEIRRRGYSIDEEENVEGVRCVGAPVLDLIGVAQAALVIQVPSVRMPPSRVQSLGRIAQQAAREVAQFVPLDHLMSR